MIHLRTIFWTSIVWLVLLAIGYIYSAFWDMTIITSLYPSLSNNTSHTGSNIENSHGHCDLNTIDSKLDLLQQHIMDISQYVRQTTWQQLSMTANNISSVTPAMQNITLRAVWSWENLVAIPRTINKTPTYIQDSISLLVDWNITTTELNQWFRSLFDQSWIKVNNTSIDNAGVLTIELSQQWLFNWGSARVLLMRTAIERTARQFSEIKNVIILPDTILQP